MELERPATSALIRLLREAGRAKPRSIGFGRDREDGKQALPMVLVAELPGLDPEAAAAAVKAGAMAVSFAVDAATASTLGSGAVLDAAVKACGEAAPGRSFAPDAAIGVDLPEIVAQAGIDFLVAPVQRAPASLLTTERLAKIPLVDASQPAALIRAIGDMDVDALCVAPPRRRRNAADLTVYDLMHYRGVAELARPPIMVVAEQAIRGADLQALRDVGVDGIVVPLRKFESTAAAAAELESMKTAIGTVRITRKSDRARGDVLLPRVAASAVPAAGDDDDDDE